MIKLPLYEWFMGLISFHGKGNVYAGSAGTDPKNGCMSDNIFRYRVWLDNDEDETMKLFAVHYMGRNSYDATDKESMTKKTFEASAAGVEQAQKWLIDACNEAEKR